LGFGQQGGTQGRVFLKNFKDRPKYKKNSQNRKQAKLVSGKFEIFHRIWDFLGSGLGVKNILRGSDQFYTPNLKLRNFGFSTNK
jgi:hypothetical protein